MYTYIYIYLYLHIYIYIPLHPNTFWEGICTPNIYLKHFLMQEVFRCLVIYPPVNIAMDIHLFHWEIHSTNGGFSIAMLVYRSVYIIRYLEHKRNPCFDRKRPCFFWGGQVTFKNRGHLGSRYIYIFMSREPLGFSSQTTLQARSWRSLFAKVGGPATLLGLPGGSCQDL